MRRMVVASVLAFAMLVGGTATAAVRSEKVIGGPGDQYWPSSNGVHVAFSSYRRPIEDVFVSRLGGTARTRINANDEEATLGTLIAGTDQIVFQQFRRYRSDLYFYDISTRRRWLVPRPVKSDKWEYWPAGSQEFILFLRYFGGRNDHSELLLYDRVTDDLQTLIADIGGKRIFPGFAGARYVAWTTCGGGTCSISYYDSDTDTITKLPPPSGKARYAPAIDEATGAIYFVESHADKCGRNVTLRTTTIGVPGTTALATLPNTIDTGWTLGLTPNSDSGFQDIYYERWDCQRETGDIYRFVSVDEPAPTIARTTRSLGGSGFGTRPLTMPGAPREA